MPDHTPLVPKSLNSDAVSGSEDGVATPIDALILCRLASVCILTPDEMDRPITAESLQKLLQTPHHDFPRPTLLGLCETRPFFDRWYPLDDDLAVVLKRLAKAYAPCERNNYKQRTFRQVINDSEDELPVLSSETVQDIAELSIQPFVHKDSLREMLARETFGLDADDEEFQEKHSKRVERVVDIFFYKQEGGSGSEYVCSDTLVDVLNAFQGPRSSRYWFAGDYAAKVIRSRAHNSTCLIFFVIVAILIGIVATADVWRMNELNSASGAFFTWSNYCEEGVESTCYFLARSLSSLRTREESLRFIRRELVSNLWGFAAGNQGAADVPFGAAWFLGTLLVRASPPAFEKPAISCEDLNITMGFRSSSTNRLFPCGATHYVSVPFHATENEAYALLEGFNIGPAESDVAVTMTYTMFDPNTGYTALNEASLVFLGAGGVIPRSRSYIANHRDTYTVTVLSATLSAAFFVFENASAFIAKIRGLPTPFRTFNFLLKFAAAVFVATAAVTTASVDPQHWATANFVPRDLDAAVYNSNLGRSCLAAFLLLFIGSGYSYFGTVRSLSLVVRLVEAAAAPIIASVIVFMSCFMALVMLALLTLGILDVNFATFALAFRVMFPLLLGQGNPAQFTGEYQSYGVAFYSAFSVLAIYISLNVFTAIVMAPLDGLISLDTAIYDTAVFEARKALSRAGRRHKYNAVHLLALSGAHFLTQCVPVPELVWSIPYRFFDPRSPFRDVVNSARQLLEMQAVVTNDVAKAGGRDWRNSAICRVVAKNRNFG